MAPGKSPARAVDYSRTEDLVHACINGDDAAKAWLFTEYRDMVRRAVSKKVAQVAGDGWLQSEVEDICHDLFLRLLDDGCPMLRTLHQPRSIRAWLMTVAQRQTLDYMRKSFSRTRAEVDAVAVVTDPAEGYAPPETSLARKEQTALLDRCLGSLSSMERLIVQLFYLDGLKYTEIAQICGMNINTVSARLRRAKLKLRALLAKEGCHDGR